MLTWPWKKKQLKVFAYYPDLSISKFHFSISWFLVDESISLGSAVSLQSFTVACFALWIIAQDNEVAGAGIVTFTLKILLFSQSFVQILLCQRDVAVMFFLWQLTITEFLKNCFPYVTARTVHTISKSPLQKSFPRCSALSHPDKRSVHSETAEQRFCRAAVQSCGGPVVAQRLRTSLQRMRTTWSPGQDSLTVPVTYRRSLPTDKLSDAMAEKGFRNTSEKSNTDDLLREAIP